MTTYRCDKCHATWQGDRDGTCPECGVGIDLGNVVVRVLSRGEDAADTVKSSFEERRLRGVLVDIQDLATFAPHVITPSEFIVELRERVDAALAPRSSSLSTGETETQQLLRFAGKALAASRADHIGDWDGGDLQDAMAECGLLAETDVTEPCCEDCSCAEFGFPTTCYRFTPLAKRAVELAGRTPGETNDG